jgi:hypothetical protein
MICFVYYNEHNPSIATLMPLQEIQLQLLSLSPTEKAQAIQLLVQSLSNTWAGIEKSVGICGGDACIVNTLLMRLIKLSKRMRQRN